MIGYIKEVQQEIQYINSEGEEISELKFYQKNSSNNRAIEKDISSIQQYY